MASENQKLKLFYLVRIFEEETDANHGLTREEITQLLAVHDIRVERKTFYDDVKRLQGFGYDIVSYNSEGTTRYALASRDFEDTELLLLADAVQSSKFLTQRKSSALIKQIGKLGSRHLATELEKHVFVEGRIRNQNESVFYSLDAIHSALVDGKKVSFKYFKYDANKKPVFQHDGEYYLETPVQLMYMDDFYYLITWNDKHESFTTYRLDRMKNINVSDEDAIVNEQTKGFDVSKFQQRVFGMFSGESVDVTLRVSTSIMSAIVDRFGKGVETEVIDSDHVRVYATVMQAPTFYGWLVTFGTQIVIEGPESLRQAYAEHLASIAREYE